MILALSATGPGPDSDLETRFGRAPWFLILDTESRTWKAIDNQPNLEAAQGAGVQSAARVADTGAACLITGHCGPKAFRALQAAGVRVYPAAGTIEEVLAAFEAGKLQELQAPDVEGHW